MTDKELLDELVVCRSRLAAVVVEAQHEDIWPCEESKQRIQISIGFERLAEAAGEEIQTSPRNDDKYPIEKSFIYHGTTFFQIGSEAIETEAHHEDHE